MAQPPEKIGSHAYAVSVKFVHSSELRNVMLRYDVLLTIVR